MILTRIAGGVGRLERGRELRSVKGSFASARRTHSRALRSLIPAASDAARTDHPCSQTRLTSWARLRGQLRAFLCTFIRDLPVYRFVFESFQIDERRSNGQ